MYNNQRVASGYVIDDDYLRRMAYMPPSSTSSSRYSHPAASVSDPIYQTRDSSAFDSNGLTPSESDQISRINNGMKGLAMKLPSRDSSPGSVDETEDFVVLDGSGSPSTEQDDFASWITGHSSKSPPIGCSRDELESVQEDLSDVSELAERVRSQLNANLKSANDQNAVLKQLKEQSASVPVAAVRRQATSPRGEASGGQDDATDFSAQTSEESFIKHSMHEVQKKDKEISQLRKQLEIHYEMSKNANSYNGQLLKLQSEKSEMQAAFEQQVNSYENVVSKLKLDLTDKEELIGELKNEIGLLRTEKQNIENKIMASDGENKKLLEEMIEQNRRTEQENYSLKEKIDKAEEQVRAGYEEAAKKEEELQDVRKLSEEMQGENERLSNELAQMQKEMVDWKEKAKQVELEMKETKRNAKDLEEKEENLRSIISNMQQRQQSEARDYESKWAGELKKYKSLAEAKERKIAELTTSLTEAVPKLDMLAQQNPPYEQLMNFCKRANEGIKERDMTIKQYEGFIQTHVQNSGFNQPNPENAALKFEIEKLSREAVESQEHAEKWYKAMVEKENLAANLKQQVEQKNREVNELQKSIVELKEEVDLTKAQVSVHIEDFKEERERANRIKNEQEQAKQDWLLKEEELKTAIKKLEKAKEEEDRCALQRNGTITRNRQINGYTTGGTTGRQNPALSDRNGAGNRRDPYEQRRNGGDLNGSGAYGGYYGTGAYGGAENRGSESNYQVQENYYEPIDADYDNVGVNNAENGTFGWGRAQEVKGQKRGMLDSVRDSAYGMLGYGKDGNNGKAQKQKPRENRPKFQCPLCVDDTIQFPDADGLNVHINEDHPELGN